MPYVVYKHIVVDEQTYKLHSRRDGEEERIVEDENVVNTNKEGAEGAEEKVK